MEDSLRLPIYYYRLRAVFMSQGAAAVSDGITHDSSVRPALVRAKEKVLTFLFWCLVALLIGVISLDRLHWLIYDKAWINPWHEGFAWTFLPAIKMGWANDYWYHYFGLTGLPIVTRFLHWIARTVQGSSELTLDYAVLFGKLYFSFIYIAIVLLCSLIIRWAGWRLGFPILIMLLVLNYLDLFSQSYHKIVNTLGFFELYLYAYTALMVYLITSFRAGVLDYHATWLAAIGGGLAGSLFFDLSINGWLFLFFTASLLSLVERGRRWRCVAVSAAAGIVVGPLLLWTAYGFHIWQASFALVQHLHIIIHGAGRASAGFWDFFTFSFPPIQYHVVMLCAVAIWTMGMLERVSRSRGNKDGTCQRRWERLLLAIDVVFAISASACTYALYRQPTGTVFESLILLCLVYIGYRLFVMVPAAKAQQPRRRHWTWTAALVTIFGIGATALSAKDIPPVISILMPSHSAPVFSVDEIEARVVRSLDQFFNHFAEQYTVIESPDSYWTIHSLIYSLRFTGDLIVTGLGPPSGARLLPLEAEIERKYVQRYRFVEIGSIVSVTDDCQVPTIPPAEYADRLQGLVSWCATLQSPLGRKFLNVGISRLVLGREVYLFPFPFAVGKAIYDRAAKDVAWRVPTDAGSSSPRRLLSTEGNVGIRHEVEGHLGWSLMPVDLESVKPSLTPLAMPLAEGGYRGYLLQVIGAFLPNYILILVRADVAP